MKKLKKKISLPKDRTGRPICIGDIVAWEGGDVMIVDHMVYYGDKWELGEGDEYADNIEHGEVIWPKKGGKRGKRKG